MDDYGDDNVNVDETYLDTRPPTPEELWDRAHRRRIAADLERYRETMRKVRLAVRDALSPEEYEDLLIACECGDRWHADRLRAAAGEPPTPG